ncbi:MAG: hypothetical protein AAB798_02610 [Patescibacteria group bacterium]
MSTVATRRSTDIELKALVAHSVREILDDPDYGLELRDDFKKRLVAARRTQSRGIPLADIRKKYY